MRGSNSIEGYDVSLDDALALLESDDEPLDADQRTVLEVTGYRNAMTYVQQLAEDPDFHFDQSLRQTDPGVWHAGATGFSPIRADTSNKNSTSAWVETQPLLWVLPFFSAPVM